LGRERFPDRHKRGLSTLVLRLGWLALARRGSGRPHHVGLLREPLLAAWPVVARLPTAPTLHRALAYLSAHDVRAARAAAYLAELARRPGRVALDSQQLPDGGHGHRGRMRKGCSGAPGHCLRGYRLHLTAVPPQGSAECT
jgi:hypothetical protein